MNRTLRISDVPTRVMTFGAGPPLLLIHGLAGSTDWWVRNIDALSSRHTLYLTDLPGFGSMRKYARLFSVAAAVKWLAELVSALDLQRTAVLGHSMGGLIAATFAANYPDRVDALVLAAPAISLTHKSVLPFLLPLAKEASYVRPAFFPTLMRDTVRAGLVTLLRASRDLLSVDTNRELGKIKAPSLLIFGERDPLVPVSIAQTVQDQIKTSRLTVLPGAGHIVMYDRADLFNPAVLQFLRESERIRQ